MPKSAEAKARAAKALKEKRHRLKAEREAKAQLDAAAEVTCEGCKKHIAASFRARRGYRQAGISQPASAQIAVSSANIAF